MDKSTNANVSIMNLPSWEGLEFQKAIFTFDLNGQSQNRQNYVSDVLNSMGCKASAVFCLLDYDFGKARDVYSDQAQGRYLVCQQEDQREEKFILQVKPSIHKEAYFLNDDVFAHLNDNGVLAPALVPFKGKTVFSFKGFDVAAVTYRDGTHFDPADIGQMEVLGEGAARLESAMKVMPEPLRERIIKGATDRNRVVQSGIKYALDEANGAHIKSMVLSMDLERLKRSIENFQEAEPEVCHGDLVQMNVIITDEDQMAVLDFDDMNYLPEGMDLGMLAFRVGLDGRSDKNPEYDCVVAHAIVRGYNDVSSENDRITLEYLRDTMDLAATYKAMLALGMVAEGIKSDLSAEDRFKAHGGKYANGIKRLDALLSNNPRSDYTLDI